MRTYIFIALLLLTTPSLQFSWNDQISELQENGWDIMTNSYGVIKAIMEHPDKVEQLLVEGFDIFQTVMNSPSLYQDYLDRILSFTKEDAEDVILTCSKGDKENFWKMASWPVGIVGKGLSSGQQESITLESRPDDCFEKVDLIFMMLDNDSYQLTFKPLGTKKTDDCSDLYTLATAAAIHEPINLKSEHIVTVQKSAANKMKQISLFGLHVYRACDKFANLWPDLFLTASLFLGGFGTNPDVPIFGSKPTWWMEELNPLFIKRGTGFQWRERKDTFVDLDATEVKSGDFLCITRMDGLDQIIQWGAGSICGHSVVLLEFDGEMYAIESQDAWYWPKHDIQRNPWKQWKQWAKNAGFNVILIPMREDIRANLNIEKAAEFFRSVEGMPYGYHNFIFGWLDVPKYNVPPVTTMDFLFVLFAELERIYAYPVVRIMGEALNKRMNTTGLTLEEIGNIMVLRGISIDDIFGMVEQDDWVYSDGKSMVCSSFVIAIYKAGGLFGDLSVQATEFTPRDIYQLNFWENGYKAEKCKGVDDDLPYCQIMGKHKLDVFKDKYNTVDPYDHMFEKCPSMPPKYERPNDC